MDSIESGCLYTLIEGRPRVCDLFVLIIGFGLDPSLPFSMVSGHGIHIWRHYKWLLILGRYRRQSLQVFFLIRIRSSL